MRYNVKYDHKCRPTGRDPWPNPYIDEFVDIISHFNFADNLDSYSSKRICTDTLIQHLQRRAQQLFDNNICTNNFYGTVSPVDAIIFTNTHINHHIATSLYVRCLSSNMYGWFSLSVATHNDNNIRDLTLNDLVF